MSRISFPSSVLAITLTLGWSCSSPLPPVATSVDGDAGPPSSSGASDGGSSSGDASPACASGTFALTLLNYEGWCKVTVAGAGLSTALRTTVCIPPGATNVVAVPGRRSPRDRAHSLVWHAQRHRERRPGERSGERRDRVDQRRRHPDERQQVRLGVLPVPEWNGVSGEHDVPLRLERGDRFGRDLRSRVPCAQGA